MTPEEERKPGDEEHERLRLTSRYSLWVGIAFLAVASVALLNTLGGDDGGVLGGTESDAGTPLAGFAVPRLPEGPEGDANVYQDDCGTSENPCPADERRTPACEVELAHVIRVCDLFDRPLVISFWFTTPADCPPTQDAVDAAARNFRGTVNFLSVAIRGERAELERIIAERGWEIPVGWDRDGAVSNLYRVGVCPTVAFVREGGTLGSAAIGSGVLDADRLEREIVGLVRESRRLAEASR